MRISSVALVVLFGAVTLRAQDAPLAAGPSTVAPQVSVDLAEVGLAGRLTAGRVTIGPGITRPDHTHTGRTSLLVVVQGSLTEVRGSVKHEYNVGDVVAVAEGVTHHAENHGAGPLVYIEINATANKQ
jgi:mannose-6-phosphate isomerase-like protein (cupin superfamily)